MKERLEAFGRRAVELMEKLDDLKRRHQLLPFADQDFSEPMVGDTLALYNAVESARARLRETWVALMETKQRAEGMVKLERPLATVQHEQAKKLLAAAPHFSEIDALLGQCVANLDQLEKAHEDAARQSAEAQAAAQAMGQLLARIREAGLPTAPYEGAAEACQQLDAQAATMLRSDPLGAARTLAQSQAQRTTLRGWLEGILKLHDQWHAAAAELAAVETNVAEHRQAGYRLCEQGGNPDPVLADGRRGHQAAAEAIRQGDAAAARHQLDLVQRAVAAARDLVRRQVEAKARCLQQLPACAEVTRQLQPRLQTAQLQRQTLEREFDRDSWSTVEGNLEQAQALYDTLEATRREAASAAADDTQAYFQAVHLLDRLAGAQQQIAGLLSAQESRLHELTALRQRCLARRDELANRAGQLASYVASHARSVGGDAQRLYRAALEEQARVVAAGQQTRPHWPRISSGLDQALQAVAAAQEKAAHDVRQHELFVAQLEAARSEVHRIGTFLRSQAADRPAVNQRFQEASRNLEHLAQVGGGPQPADWQLLLRLLNEATAVLTKVEQAAQQDIRLAQQAASALAEAQRACQQAGAFFKLGISADVTAAESQVAQAGRLLEAQSYEQAIQMANTAAAAARSGLEQAQRLAEQKQRQMDEERRQQEAAAQRLAAAQRAAANAPPGTPSAQATPGPAPAGSANPASIPPPSTSSPPDPSHKGTSTTTWQSGSGQTTW